MFFLFLPCCSGTEHYITLHFYNSWGLLLVSVQVWREETSMSLPRWSEDRITIMWEVFVVIGVALYFLKPKHKICTLRLFLKSTVSQCAKLNFFTSGNLGVVILEGSGWMSSVSEEKSYQYTQGYGNWISYCFLRKSKNGYNFSKSSNEINIVVDSR